METFSRGQQVVVFLIIIGMVLLYFHSINQQNSQEVGRAMLANSRRAQPALQSVQLSSDTSQPKGMGSEDGISGAKLLTLNRSINLNTSSKHDLEAIPGIGARMAEKIVDYRKKHGPFKTVKDIMNISGIKEKKFEKIKSFLTVN